MECNFVYMECKFFCMQCNFLRVCFACEIFAFAALGGTCFQDVLVAVMCFLWLVCIRFTCDLHAESWDYSGSHVVG